jgi:uncharacterized repeat protein (TIGR03806 family)
MRRAPFLLAVLALACGGKSAPPAPGGDGTYVTTPYQTLEEYGVVEMDGGTVQTRAGVTPYDLNTPLWSDGAIKRRAVYLPKGQTATYDENNSFTFPTGTLLIKSFGFGDDLRKSQPVINWVETRLLIKTDSSWNAVTYLWNDQQTEAKLFLGGEVKDLTYLDAAGASVSAHYLVPSGAQCAQCHASNGAMTALGPKARNLNRTYTYPDGSTANQLTHWTSAGILAGAPVDPSTAPLLPVWNDSANYTVEQRARAYLEVNCAHCHSDGGFARNTGLYLWSSEPQGTVTGLCKPPVAAGAASGNFPYDVVPGQPDDSIMTYRLASTTPSIAMPQLARSVVDQQGLALVREWIAGLPGKCGN